MNHLDATMIYLCHPLVLSSPTLMTHGHMNLKNAGTVF